MNARKCWLPVATLLIMCMLAAACGAPAPSAQTDGQPVADATSAPTDATSAPAPADATSAPAPADATSAPATGEQIELRIAWWGSQDRHDRTLKVIEMFQQEHPNIKIVPEYGNFNDHWTKLTTQAAGNNMPDIIQQDYQKITEFVSRDLLLPLDEYVASGQIDLGSVDEKQIAGGRLDGKLYAVNLGTNALGMVFDQAQYEQAGLAIPDGDWTWADFEQTMTKLHDSLGIYGHDGNLYSIEVFKLWLKQHGQWLYNDTGAALGYDDDQLFADFFAMLLRLQEAGSIPTREFDAGRGTVGIEDSLLVQQQAATNFMWSNQLVATAKAAGERQLQIGMMPGVEGGEQGHYLKPSMFFSISSQSKHPAEAAMFIDYFTNSVEANQVLLAERGVPISSQVREALVPSLNPAQKAMFDYISLIEQNSSPINPPDPPSATKLGNEVYLTILDEILYGQLSPEDGARRFREEASAVLAGQ